MAKTFGQVPRQSEWYIQMQAVQAMVTTVLSMVVTLHGASGPRRKPNRVLPGGNSR